MHFSYFRLHSLASFYTIVLIGLYLSIVMCPGPRKGGNVQDKPRKQPAKSHQTNPSQQERRVGTSLISRKPRLRSELNYDWRLSRTPLLMRFNIAQRLTDSAIASSQTAQIQTSPLSRPLQIMRVHPTPEQREPMTQSQSIDRIKEIQWLLSKWSTGRFKMTTNQRHILLSTMAYKVTFFKPQVRDYLNNEQKQSLQQANKMIKNQKSFEKDGLMILGEPIQISHATIQIRRILKWRARQYKTQDSKTLEKILSNILIGLSEADLWCIQSLLGIRLTKEHWRAIYQQNQYGLEAIQRQINLLLIRPKKDKQSLFSLFQRLGSLPPEARMLLIGHPKQQALNVQSKINQLYRITTKQIVDNIQTKEVTFEQLEASTDQIKLISQVSNDLVDLTNPIQMKELLLKPDLVRRQYELVDLIIEKFPFVTGTNSELQLQKIILDLRRFLKVYPELQIESLLDFLDAVKITATQSSVEEDTIFNSIQFYSLLLRFLLSTDSLSDSSRLLSKYAFIKMQNQLTLQQREELKLLFGLDSLEITDSLLKNNNKLLKDKESKIKIQNYLKLLEIISIDRANSVRSQEKQLALQVQFQIFLKSPSCQKIFKNIVKNHQSVKLVTRKIQDNNPLCAGLLEFITSVNHQETQKSKVFGGLIKPKRLKLFESYYSLNQLQRLAFQNFSSELQYFERQKVKLGSVAQQFLRDYQWLSSQKIQDLKQGRKQASLETAISAWSFISHWEQTTEQKHQQLRLIGYQKTIAMLRAQFSTSQKVCSLLTDSQKAEILNTAHQRHGLVSLIQNDLLGKIHTTLFANYYQASFLAKYVIQQQKSTKLTQIMEEAIKSSQLNPSDKIIYIITNCLVSAIQQEQSVIRQENSPLRNLQLVQNGDFIRRLISSASKYQNVYKILSIFGGARKPINAVLSQISHNNRLLSDLFDQSELQSVLAIVSEFKQASKNSFGFSKQELSPEESSKVWKHIQGKEMKTAVAICEGLNLNYDSLKRQAQRFEILTNPRFLNENALWGIPIPTQSLLLKAGYELSLRGRVEFKTQLLENQEAQISIQVQNQLLFIEIFEQGEQAIARKLSLVFSVVKLTQNIFDSSSRVAQEAHLQLQCLLASLHSDTKAWLNECMNLNIEQVEKLLKLPQEVVSLRNELLQTNKAIKDLQLIVQSLHARQGYRTQSDSPNRKNSDQALQRIMGNDSQQLDKILQLLGLPFKAQLPQYWVNDQ